MIQTLIIFVRNPIEGQVKTRIARVVGDARATEIYQYLLMHTRQVSGELHSPAGSELRRVVYYADYVNDRDLWNGYEKFRQAEGDLGERMRRAFEEQLARGADRCVIIGSDCLDLTESHLREAFRLLDTHDCVFGPATDGGYYLLGLKQVIPSIFENKPWSQPTLLEETLAELDSQGISYTLLETLSDVDEWEDAERYGL